MIGVFALTGDLAFIATFGLALAGAAAFLATAFAGRARFTAVFFFAAALTAFFTLRVDLGLLTGFACLAFFMTLAFALVPTLLLFPVTDFFVLTADLISLTAFFNTSLPRATFVFTVLDADTDLDAFEDILTDDFVPFPDTAIPVFFDLTFAFLCEPFERLSLICDSL